MPNLYHSYDIPDALFERSERILEDLRPTFERLERIKEKRQLDVLKAFGDNYFCESELHGSTGYGYDDRGRDKLEAVLAQSMGAEAAYMRWQFAGYAGSLPDAARPPQAGRRAAHRLGRSLRQPETQRRRLGHARPGNLRSWRHGPLRRLARPPTRHSQIIQELRDETALVYVQKSRGWPASRLLSEQTSVASKRPSRRRLRPSAGRGQLLRRICQ